MMTSTAGKGGVAKFVSRYANYVNKSDDFVPTTFKKYTTSDST